MIQGLKDLLNSEHGLFGVLIMICATVLVGLGKLTTDQWVSFAEWIFTAYAGAHGLVAIAGAVESKSSTPSASLGKGSGGAGTVVITQATTGDAK